MSSKALFVILGVLVILFVFGIGLGSCSHEDAESNPPWTEKLGTMLAP